MSTEAGGDIGRELERWLEELAASPPSEQRPLDAAASDLTERLPAFPQLGTALSALAAAERRRAHLDAQAEQYRRLGWRLMRPLIGLGIVAALLSMFQQVIDPAVGLTIFLAGAVALYLVLQVYVALWTRAAEKAAAQSTDELRARLGETLAKVRPD